MGKLVPVAFCAALGCDPNWTTDIMELQEMNHPFNPDMVLAAIGHYRLRVAATLDNRHAIPALFKVPILELESATPHLCLI